LGYGPFVKFDHDFIGREALEKIAAGPHRKKVTLALDNESVTEVIYAQFTKGELRPKYMEFPSAVYSMHPFDRVEKDGKLIGLSTWIAHSANEGKMLTLAMIDESLAEPGTEVDFIWGEPDGGTTKPTVEPHKQVTIKAVVASVPYSEVARTSYAESWRTKAA
jgi:glycine cleavage system aminomethyltransferase T